MSINTQRKSSKRDTEKKNYSMIFVPFAIKHFPLCFLQQHYKEDLG